MGDPSAQFNLALRCDEKNTPQDKQDAVAWYRRAAASGNPTAQFNLAIHLARGEGVAKDEKEAVRWFYAAALQGIFEA